MEKFFLGVCLGAFLILMALRGAALRDERDQLAARVEEQQRVITQLANRPTPAPIVVRVPAAPVVVYAPGPVLPWGWLAALAGAGLSVAVGLAWLVGLVATRPATPPTPAPDVLHPGDPGFDDAAASAAAAVGGVVSECEGVYWLTVPGRAPVRVLRLLGVGDG